MNKFALRAVINALALIIVSYLTSAILQGITYHIKMKALTARHAPSLELSS